MYGSSRLGIYNTDMVMATQDYNINGYNNTGEFNNPSPFFNTKVLTTLPSLPTIYLVYKGKKQLELSNHLGNVLATISDRRIARDDNGDLLIDYYNADISSTSDYYAFGSAMPGREIGNYRYGFNGKEKDKESFNDAYDFGARIYDGRLGRWLTVDSKRHLSPELTPFRFGFCDPIRFNDPDGNWEEDGHFWTVYALSLSMGLKNQDALNLAKAAEFWDHKVHGYKFDDLKFELNKDKVVGLGFITNPNTISTFGLGTWSDPKMQCEYHALCGTNSDEKRAEVVNLILTSYNLIGRIRYLHTFGDTYAHSKESTKNTMLYGRNDGHLTLEHAVTGGAEGLCADNISDRGNQYMTYVNDLVDLIHSIKSYTVLPTYWQQLGPQTYQLNPSCPSNTFIFEYISKANTTKDQNIELFKFYIAFKTGQEYTYTIQTSLENENWLEKGLNFAGIKYTKQDVSLINNCGQESPSGSIPCTYKYSISK